MLNKIKNLVMALAVFATVAAPALVVVPAYADDGTGLITNGLCKGVGFNVDTTPSTTPTNCDPSGFGTEKLNSFLALAINVFSAVVGVIAVIMIIVGGLRYITSGGDSGKVSAAKTTIIYALIGLVVVALAQLIVRFVLAQALGIANSGA